MIQKYFQKIFPTSLSYRNFIFLPLFFSAYIVLQVFRGLGYPLEDFTGRSVSVATYEALDISARVTLFYRGMAFLLVLVVLFTRITVLLKPFVLEAELSIANGLSLAGLCLLYFDLSGADMKPTLHVIFALLVICAAGFIYHRLRPRDNKPFTVIFLWSVLLSTSLFFLLWQTCQFAGIPRFFSLPKVLVAAGVPLYLAFTKKISLTDSWMRATRSLMFIPLLSFASVELFMIMNQRGITIPAPLIYFLGLAGIAVVAIRNYKKHAPAENHLVRTENIFRNWMPWMLAGIACIALYRPVMQPEIDWFESANVVLPLQQWFSFGKIPFLDTYSSHALSDFGFGLVYAVFNGTNPMGVFVYRFLMTVLVLLIVYFFLYKVTGDGFIATWFAIAYPYADLLIPSYYNFVPLAALAFLLVYEKQTIRRYAFFFGTVLFMPLWRVDLGLSTLVAGGGGLAVLLFFVPAFRPDYKKLASGLLVILSVIFLLFIAAFILAGTHLFVSLKDALAYMSSFQSYGLTALSYSRDIKYYSLYFVLPVTVLLLVIHTVYSLFRNKNSDRHAVLARLALVFLGIFYLANLQRGLVRHTLAEQWDTAFTSYGFFLVTLFMLLRFLDKSPFLRFFIFFLAGTLVTANYLFTAPDLKTNNFYHVLKERIEVPAPIPQPGERIDRTPENPGYKNRYEDFSVWLNKTLPPASTYLDFSNTPMLYYFTNRSLPNYLVQIPHTAHNDFLQDRFLQDLRLYDIPVTVFSNEPKTFWDRLDGIPNPARHYKISEYIYRNYKPSVIINQHCIWIKKDAPQPADKEVIPVSAGAMIVNGVGVRDGNIYQATGIGGTLNYIPDRPLAFAGRKWSYSIYAETPVACEIATGYRAPGTEYNEKHKKVFKLAPGRNELFVMAEPMEGEKEIGEIYFSLPPGVEVLLSEMKITASDNYPDRISYQPVEYNLKWIPYIWGTYDSNYLEGKIIPQQEIVTGNPVFRASESRRLDFVPVKNKAEGNYLKFTARAPAGNPSDLLVSYGDDAGQNGAFIFTLKNDTAYHDYLVRVSSQYLWYLRDNSWIRIRPEGNDVEIREAAILKGDE